MGFGALLAPAGPRVLKDSNAAHALGGDPVVRGTFGGRIGSKSSPRLDVFCLLLMRPAEIWNAKRKHIRTPSEESLLLENIAIITIGNAKNRAFMGRLQVRSVRDIASVQWLAWLTSDLDSEDKIWAFTPVLFRRLLAESLQFLGAAGLGITSASFRAGGATTLLERGVPLSTIRFCGSWSSERVMATYLQESEAAAAMLRVPQHGVARVKSLLSEFGEYRSPPRLPLCRLVQQRWTRSGRSSSSPPLR